MGPRPRLTVQVLSVLNVMFEAPQASWYGLELAARASLKTGTIYPILARLESAGWLQSYAEEIDPSKEGRPRRRLYRLTGEGVRTGRAALTEFRTRIGAAEEPPARVRLRPERQTA